MGVIFDETEATGRLVESVKSHHQTLDLSTSVDVNRRLMIISSGKVR